MAQAIQTILQAVLRTFTGMFGERSKYSLEFKLEGQITQSIDGTSNRIAISEAMSNILGMLPIRLEALYDELWAMHPEAKELQTWQLANFPVRLLIPMPNDMGLIDLLITLDLELTGISDEDLQALLAEMVLMEIIFLLVTTLIPDMDHDEAGKYSRGVLKAFCDGKGIDFELITQGIGRRELVGATAGGSGSEGGGIQEHRSDAGLG